MDNKTCATGAFLLDDTGAEEFITPLLGASMGGIRLGGSIRPGVMVLRKEGVTEEDRKKYEQMLAAGTKWDDIDKALGPVEKPGKLAGKSKLVPLNVDYFTVNKHDCVDPGHADLIMKKYADADGKLRGLPVYFPTNDWWELIPHSLSCYGRTTGIKHRSGFVPQKDERGRVTGLNRICETPEQVEKGRRVFGGRSWQFKDCDPEECEHYQKGDCKLRGRVQFMIPGIPGANMWGIPTTSFYSLSMIKDTLKRVHEATNGRIANIIYEGDTIFALRKRLGNVPSIDIATGEPKMRRQYLIHLDLTVDLFEVAKMYQANRVLARGTAAANILTDGNVVDITERVKAHEEAAPEETAPESGPTEDERLSTQQEQEIGERSPETPLGGREGPSETSRPPADTKAKGNGNNSPVSPNQIDAIRKLCARFQMPEVFVERELPNIKTATMAAEFIRDLNRGDLSRFLPKEEE